MDGKSLSPHIDKLNQLKQILPEAFAEDKIDWEKLRAALGENINFSNERYVLNWAGKSDAFRIMQQPSTRTLVPMEEESANFNDTQNIFIEGENLEVLKVLQKSYFGKVKMIYIDPPYNTGNDSFIYPDKFSETKEAYQKRVGDKNEDGYMTTEGMFRKNSRENGQYHSNWLNMMMPRLYLARTLLRDDGVIFVSIDDNEVHNLRLLMNEIFGEENFVGMIIWKKKTNGNNMGLIPPVHDYIICFAKSIINVDEKEFGFSISDEHIKNNYSNPDNDRRGVWTTTDLSANHKGPYFPIVNPTTEEVHYPPKGRYWVFNEKEVETRIRDGRIIFGKTGKTKPVQKVFLKDRELKRLKAESWWDKYGMNEDATAELNGLFETAKIFVHSKPSNVIAKLISFSTSSNDIILDFFAGSATTAHAVMQLNKEEGGNRKYILVQMPELCDEKSEAYKAGYRTIADIAKERIRRAGKKLQDEIEADNKKKETQLNFDNQENQPTDLDTGFKVFRLSKSNFKQWQQPKNYSAEALAAQLKLFIDPVAENANLKNMVYELLLKSGKDLNMKIEDNDGYYLIDGNELALILERVDEQLITEVLSEYPKKVIALDRIFKGNDQLKTNTALQMKDAGVEFKTI